MPTIRSVRRLRLRATSEEQVRSAALIFADAMRTASLHDEGGRLVIVRRLALGRIPAGATPQTLALALERAVGQSDFNYRHGRQERAADADAVWFHDVSEAYTLLALGLLQGQTMAAWYWPLAVPGWRRETGLSDSLRLMALSLAEREDAPAALPRWIAAVVGAGHGGSLGTTFSPSDLRKLADAVGVPLRPVGSALRSRSGTTVPPNTPHSAAAPGPPTAADLSTPMTDREDADAGDPRSVLWQALCRAVGVPFQSNSLRRGERAPGRSAPKSAEAFAAAPTGQPRHPSDPAVQLDPTVPPRSTHDAEPLLEPSLSARDRTRPVSPLTEAPRSCEVGSARQPTPNAGRFVPPIMAYPSGGEARPGIGDPTAAGGLLFLIHALRHCGYGEWLQGHPAWQRHELARAMFALALGRLRLPAEDPAWQITLGPAERPGLPPHFLAPEYWRQHLAASGAPRHSSGERQGTIWDASGRLLLAAWRRPRPRAASRLVREARADAAAALTAPDRAAVAQAWLTACRRWLRRRAGIGLADLILRDAQLAHTPTHLDLRFDLSRVEIRIRKAGLDLDPGWVPWLKRVVNLHYGRRSGATS